MRNNIWIGGALATLVLLLFLRSVQSVGIIAMSIPMTSVQTVGVVVLSILIGLWIHDWFGGNPELRDLKAAVQEFRLGANALSPNYSRRGLNLVVSVD